MLTTARYGFPQIQLSPSPDNVDVVADFNTPWAKVDTLLGSQVCTSSTRPSSPVQGQLIFETDTGYVRKYNGSAWTTVGNAVSTSGSRPANPMAGDELWESNTGQSRFYNGTAWSGFLATATSGSLPANPIAGDLVYLTDIGAVAYYSGTAWHISTPATCTSTTRPTGSALQTGTVIYETDTKRIMVWGGSTWDNKSGSTVLTSTTRPGTPGQGHQVFETDTGMNSLYTGSFWGYNLMQIAAPQVVSGAANITFSSVKPVQRLVLLWTAHLGATGSTDLQIQVDGDTAAHYTYAKITGRGAATSASDGGGLTTLMKFGVVGGTTASYQSSGVLVMDNWNQSSGFATFTSNAIAWDAATSYWIEHYGGQYAVVGPHNSIKIFPGSSTLTGTFSLYGAM